ncbi:hypothetical protein A2U01_0047609, partial [Trifolium medium]|nr:hypothetical protein [Trifolium medium]
TCAPLQKAEQRVELLNFRLFCPRYLRGAQEGLSPAQNTVHRLTNVDFG